MRTPPEPYIGGRSGPSWLEGWAHIIARESSAAPKVYKCMRHVSCHAICCNMPSAVSVFCPSQPLQLQRRRRRGEEGWFRLIFVVRVACVVQGIDIEKVIVVTLWSLPYDAWT